MFIGRDKLFDLLRTSGLLIKRRRSKKPQTTWSYHWYKKYPNLIQGFVPTRPGQLWVSDLTYICVGKHFAYLSLITDAYSHKIVGFYLSKNLEARGCVKALKMALQNNPGCEGLIHHSDRGVQYCCSEYVDILQSRQVHISMTQDGNPRHNAIAERVNGILKAELLKEYYNDFKEATEDIPASIAVYNIKRPHLSINMFTPEKAHHLEGPIQKKWKHYPKKKGGP
jgi:transposase InsO family protein